MPANLESSRVAVLAGAAEDRLELFAVIQSDVRAVDGDKPHPLVCLRTIFTGNDFGGHIGRLAYKLRVQVGAGFESACLLTERPSVKKMRSPSSEEGHRFFRY